MIQVTDAWFDLDHPNPLHPLGLVAIDPVRRVVEVLDSRGLTVEVVVGEWLEDDGCGGALGPGCRPATPREVWGD